LATIFFKSANKYQKSIFLILVFFYVFLFFRGILRANFLPYLYNDLAYFSSFSLILVARSSGNFGDQFIGFLNSFERVLYLTLPLALYIFFAQGFKPPQSLDTRFIDDENVGLYTSVNIVYYSVFLILYVHLFRNARFKLFTFLAVIFVLLYSLFTLSRGLFVASSISLLYALFILNIKSFNIHQALKYLALIIFIIFLLYAVLTILYGATTINILFDLFKIRFFDNPDFSGGRNDEETLLFADLSTFDTIFGRGYGGANQTWIWFDLPNGINIVHKWYMHLILKGGYLYLVSFISIFILGVINIIVVNRHYYLIFFFVIFFILSSGHTQFYNFSSISLFWIFLGFGFSNRNKKIKKL
jgi:hypothetical protein